MLKKILLTGAAALILTATSIFADTTLAGWTFESLTISANSSYTNWNDGTRITNVLSEIGSGNASGLHALHGSSPWNTVSGNGSSKALTGNDWSVNDYVQFAVSTVGFQNIIFDLNQVGSGSGPRDFKLQYSTDGATFTDVPGGAYSLPNITSWSSSSSNAASAFSYDLSSITALNNQSLIYIRVVVNSTTSITGGTVGTAGTARFDNVAIIGSSTSPGAGFVIYPSGTNAYLGDWVTFSAIESGSDPLSNQWYYSSSGNEGTYFPLSDGPSGYGSGSITGALTATLRLHYVDPAQAGYYELGVSNLYSSGYVYAPPVQLTVSTRTPIATNIAGLRVKQDANWKPTDTTNLYTVSGIVTTPFNFTTSAGDMEFYMQDASGCGISVFVYNDTSLPNPGDIVTVTAPVGQYNGLLQMEVDVNDPANSLSTVSTGNSLPAPKYFDLTQWTNVAFIETNVEGALVVISNVFFDQTSLEFISGGTPNMTNANGGKLTAFINAGASEIIAQNVPVFAPSVVGVMSQFTTGTPANSGYEFDLLHYADIAQGNMGLLPMTVQSPNGADAVISWNASLFHLQYSTNLVTGPWTDIVPSSSPYTNYNAAASGSLFFRLAH